MQQKGSLSTACKEEKQTVSPKSCIHLSDKNLRWKYTDFISEISDITRIGQEFLPSVVLSVEQEVCTHDGDAHSHDAKNNQNQHHETVHIVYFVGPERCEDEVPEKGGQKAH